MHRKGNDIRKRDIHSCFYLCSFCFWVEVSNSRMLNETSCWEVEKIAKFLMRTFICRSTFFNDQRTKK